ncbi:phasin family protein [Novosphingobium soli]|uniref:Phasin family protein n=1 Tax=Novosphingobium soli TaxID=574956 RepID=A0ABV6CZ11_9SPHN
MADNEDPKITIPAAEPQASAVEMPAKPTPPLAAAPQAPKPEAAKPASTAASAAALAAPLKTPVAAPLKDSGAPLKGPAKRVAKAPLADAPVAKPGRKPKIKMNPAAAVKPKPVEAVVPARVAPTLPATKVVKDVGSAAAAAPVPKAATPIAAPKTASNEKPVFAGLFSNFMLEDTTMDMSANFTGFQDAITQAQAKARAAFDKSTSALGEASEFAKGNVEAMVESSKIFAEGVQGLGSEIVAESRTAFEAFSGDIKELAAAKSPTDFFKIQSDLVRKNLDTAVAYGSKNSEAMLKLFSDTFAPLSGRMSIAIEKARSAAVV